MKNANTHVIIVADMDLSRLSGDVVRTVAFATELKKKFDNVTIISSKPTKDEIVNLNGINRIYTSVKNEGGSIPNIFKRTYALINKAKELKCDDSIFLIETSPLGGYFSLFGFSNYVLDVHGIHFSEIDYAAPPWYISKRLYKKFIKFLEKRAINNAVKVNTVSKSMSNFIHIEFNVPKDKIELIPNGFFDYKVRNTNRKKIAESRGLVTFVGNLAKWANVDKIIQVANILKGEKVMFYIVGDGIYRQGLERLMKKYKLDNVVLTGHIPLDEAYEIIAQSEIMLLPFPKDICTEVACPIKVLEYMAFGKAMVIDEVDDISRLLKKKNAALVCDPFSNEDFAEKVRFLLNNDKIREEIGYNAQVISKEFSWENQGQKLVEVLENING